MGIYIEYFNLNYLNDYIQHKKYEGGYNYNF